MKVYKEYITKNFKTDEFACECCGKSEMDIDFVKTLQNLREEYGVPMRVNSGFRCKKHNKSIGSSDSSSHLWGMASDISVTDSVLRYRMIQCAQKIGIVRIGIGGDFIHFDTDNKKASPVIWTY